MNQNQRTAVVAGLGEGLGAELCRQLVGSGYRVAGLARGPEAGETLLKGLGRAHFLPLCCDLTDASQVDAALTEVENRFGAPGLYTHNAGRFLGGACQDTQPEEYEALWRTTCLAAVHGIQRVLPDMLELGRGTLLMIGATASVKAGANFSAFGAAKFALRGLAQSLARELGPQGIHVIHLVIDGVLWGERARDQFGMSEAQCLEPASVARTCLNLVEQERSAWTHELDIRPHVETF